MQEKEDKLGKKIDVLMVKVEDALNNPHLQETLKRGGEVAINLLDDESRLVRTAVIRALENFGYLARVDSWVDQDEYCYICLQIRDASIY